MKAGLGRPGNCWCSLAVPPPLARLSRGGITWRALGGCCRPLGAGGGRGDPFHAQPPAARAARALARTGAEVGWAAVRTHLYTPTLSQIRTHTHAHCHTLSHTVTCTITFSVTHMHTLNCCGHTHMPSHAFTVTHAYMHTGCHTGSHALIVMHTHSHTVTHAHTHGRRSKGLCSQCWLSTAW